MAVKSSTLNNNKISVSYLPDAEIDKIKQDYATLKSDNIIFREDINRLTDLNKHLEDELTQQRSRNLELAAENEKITQEKLYLENKVKTLGEDLERNKIKEQNMVETFNQRVIIENRAKDAECSVNKMREEKAKFEIEYRVLKEKYDELKKNYDCLENSFATTKSSHDEEINKIEEKIEVMAHEMEKLQKENSTLRGSDEKRRQEIISLEQQRDGYREKYQEQKNKNNLLNSKLAEIEEDFRNIMKERENEQSLKLKEEELKRMKLDSKAKIVSELQNRIQNYKNERLKKKSEDV
jgi:chromosome segregation ATPase